jgi:hypothetical protein
MSITVIDPNEVNNSRRNGLPDYSKMFIFVELLASRRESTVLNKRGSHSNGNVEKVFDNLTVSMLGYDPQTQKFTTRWGGVSSDGATEPQYEGFGITSIKITVNSSYIPQVEIEFTDTRGLSLFNSGKDSPYSVLHSFPPPLFQLTVKGVYGGQLTYDLHLVKQNTRFEGNTGNYLISASFVGRTYAPLTDVLFKYAEIAPYIFQSQSGSTGGSNDVTTPTNTLRDFIIKSKKLYEQIGELNENSEDVTNRQKLINKSDGLTSVYNDINGFPNTFLNTTAGNADSALVNKGFAFMENKAPSMSTTEAEGSQITNEQPANTDIEPYQNVTNDIARYDEILKTSVVVKGTTDVPVMDRNKPVRLLLSFKVGNDASVVPYVKETLKRVKSTLITKARRHFRKFQDFHRGW